MTALAVKSTLSLVLALVVVLAARKTRASLRHMVLAALFAFLLLLPLADRFAPAAVGLDIPEARVAPVLQTLPKIAPPALIQPVIQPAIQPAIDTRLDWRGLATNIYLAGAALLLAWLAVGVFRLRRLAESGEVWLDGTKRMNEIAHEANIRRPALLVLSPETAVPLTFGFRTSTIVLPLAAKTWDAEELGRALRHELEHVRRDDWALQLLARAVCALYWPHPLVWAAWRRFCFEAERACDDAVVSTFEGAEAYAGQLVSLARSVRRATTMPALGMASKSRLAARVEALLDRTQRRGRHGRFATAVAIGITLFFLVTVAPARLIAAAVSTTHDEEREPRRMRDLDTLLLGEAFIEAAADGHIGDVGRMIEAGVDVNLVVYGDGTALIAAAGRGQIDMVRYLIGKGADVNLAAYGDGNPLIAAARRGRVEVVELLLDEGARIDEMVQGDENALIQAAWHGHESVVALLIRRGADVNARYVERDEVRTPLRMAARGHHSRIQRMLLDAGARE